MRVILKKIAVLLLVILSFFVIPVKAKEVNEVKPEDLYARSAVLMDADSGRILFEKNGNEQMPMASTTKIMTCILALESGRVEETALASKNAVKQPRVHLGVYEGEKFIVKDLLYSLMLASHNDSAVIIAEHIAGTTEEFARMMNEKAKEIGCESTYFITPNGLDASNEGGQHSTTASDLARILRYCFQISPAKEEFLKITGQESYEFTDVENKRKYVCRNHNSFLKMMDGALTGKTGFTGEAGYCYTGALRRDGKTFIVSLLACGWPNNKNYKWSDTKKLMNYGIENYDYVEIPKNQTEEKFTVENAAALKDDLNNRKKMKIKTEVSKEKVLLGKNEEIRVEDHVKKEWKAPVKKGRYLGEIRYYIGDSLVSEEMVVADNSIEENTFQWCIRAVVERVFIN